MIGDVRPLLLDREDHQAVALGCAQQMGLDRQVAMIRQDPPLVCPDLGQDRGEAGQHLEPGRVTGPPPEEAALVEQPEAGLGHQAERWRVAAEGRVADAGVAGRELEHGLPHPLPAQRARDVPGAEIGGPHGPSADLAPGMDHAEIAGDRALLDGHDAAVRLVLEPGVVEQAAPSFAADPAAHALVQEGGDGLAIVRPGEAQLDPGGEPGHAWNASVAFSQSAAGWAWVRLSSSATKSQAGGSSAR